MDEPRFGVCVCGCGVETERTFAPGHNRRVQGQLLAQLANGSPHDGLLDVYVRSLRTRPAVIGFDPTPGRCLAGCGKSTKATFSAGCGIRFGDAILTHLAGGPIVAPTGIAVDEIIMVWRERQVTNHKSWARNRRHALPAPTVF